MRRWYDLLDAAMDQPNPTTKLKLAIAKITTKPEKKPKFKVVKPKNYALCGKIPCQDCGSPVHARQHNCPDCGGDMTRRFRDKVKQELQ